MAMRFFLFLAGLFLFSGAAIAQDEAGFPAFLNGVRQEAAAAGIGPAGQAALTRARFEPDYIRLDRNQPEGKQTFAKYLSNTITKARVERGQRLMAEHQALLNRISRQYGVPARFIVALWGKETDFGRNSGGQSTIDALATLAYEGRRADFFRSELINALRIIDQGHIDANDMIGSWAGAMGQCQFMPSSFFKYAVDGDGDGRIDIWNDLADVFASTANYLKTEGWNNAEPWGEEVTVPAGFNTAYIGKEKDMRSNAEWSRLGVRTLSGKPLPETRAPLNRVLVQPDGSDRIFLVSQNFMVLLHWNKSTYFATSVSLLADAIGS